MITHLQNYSYLYIMIYPSMYYAINKTCIYKNKRHYERLKTMKSTRIVSVHSMCRSECNSDIFHVFRYFVVAQLTYTTEIVTLKTVFINDCFGSLHIKVRGVMPKEFIIFIDLL